MSHCCLFLSRTLATSYSVETYAVDKWESTGTCLGSKPTLAILLFALERHFTALSLLGGLCKQFQISVMSPLNFKRTAIFWYLRKQVGVLAYPSY